VQTTALERTFITQATGGSWPIFQVDIGSVPANTLNNIWIWWNDPYVTNPQNVANVLVIPHLRVMEAH